MGMESPASRCHSFRRGMESHACGDKARKAGLLRLRRRFLTDAASPASHPSSPRSGLPARAASVSNRCRSNGRRAFRRGIESHACGDKARGAGFPPRAASVSNRCRSNGRRVFRRGMESYTSRCHAFFRRGMEFHACSDKARKAGLLRLRAVSNRCRSDGGRAFRRGIESPVCGNQARKAGFPPCAASVSNRCRSDDSRAFRRGIESPAWRCHSFRRGMEFHACSDKARKAGLLRLQRRFLTDAAAMAAAPFGGG
ncbi:MAG: hypothetical protein KatS3mg053_3813 [Candidatus Roseilinea sp.]|nr:MAG: hypothetical protein KatS3mg053_3813 [Candidatus Roseilinea sp.]